MSSQKSLFAKVIDDVKESAKEQHAVDKANFNAAKAESNASLAAAKAETKANFDEATAPNPDFQEFAAAEGLKAKLSVLISQAQRNGKNLREEDRTKYEVMLQEMRSDMNNLVVQ